MREYVVTIATLHYGDLRLELYAKDRDDAIAFVKRNHRAHFWSGKFIKVKSARRKNTTFGRAVKEAVLVHEAR